MENANHVVPLLKHLARLAAALVWCVMTMAFLVVPYAMGDSGSKLFGATHIHSAQAAVLDGRGPSASTQAA